MYRYCIQHFFTVLWAIHVFSEQSNGVWPIYMYLPNTLTHRMLLSRELPTYRENPKQLRNLGMTPKRGNMATDINRL